MSNEHKDAVKEARELLTEEQLKEIEAKIASGLGPFDAKHIPALCRTVRVAWDESARLNRLIAEATVTAPWEAGYSDYVPTAGDPVRSVKDLIAHIRERGKSIGELEASVTFWQAEALLNHFCSEHASNKRQAGFYCTICTKPFAMSVPQGERPPKYEDLITKNTALREQLAQVELARDQLSSGLSVRDAQLKEIESRLAQVVKERDDARQKLLMRRCTHPNTYPLKEATRRCHDCGAEILL